MTTLHDILWSLTNDDLSFRVKLLKVKPPSPKKADLIETIKRSMAGIGLQAIWHSLGKLEQSAVAEACHTPDLHYNEVKFAAKYGSLPLFCTPSPVTRFSSGSSWNSERATRLNLLLYAPKYSTTREVPSDLAEKLRQFVKKPPALTIVPMEAEPNEQGLSIRLTEHEALGEVMTLLRLAERGDFRISAKTGMPSAAGRGKILECLGGGDYFPTDTDYPSDKKSDEQEIGVIKPVGWSRLLLNGGYLDVTGSRSKLTTKGIAILATPPHEIIRQLWIKWLANTTWDEFNRIDTIKGQQVKGHMTAKPPRRNTITTALSECPVDRWIDLGKFSSYMRAVGHDFEVSRNTNNLYISEHKYGNFGYSGYGEWNIVQYRYLMCLLFEYAATLGLIDIAYVHPRNALADFREQWGADDLEWLSRYDGLRAFRITHLGAYCLGMASDFKPKQPASSLKLEVLSDLTIQVLSGTVQTAEKFMLEMWAEPLSPGRWRMEAERARAAAEIGHNADDFIAFLQRCDDQPLPQTVQGFFKTCVSDGTAVRNSGEAFLFECRDTATAAMILARVPHQDLCYACGENRLTVPALQIEKFRKFVRALGLGVG